MSTVQLSSQPHSDSPPRKSRFIQLSWRELVIEGLIRVAGVSTIFIVGLIFFFLVREGIPAFLDIPLRQLFAAAGIQLKAYLDCGRFWSVQSW